MTLAETLLSKLADWRPAGSGPHTLAQRDAATGWTATVSVDQNDALSCSLTELVCESDGAPRATRAWAESLTKRVRGLMEPLRLIEVDEARDEALLRSDVPTIRGQTRAHYELQLRGGRKAMLSRFVAATDPTAKRQPASFALTHEAMGQVIDTITAPLD